jgi:pSer/pThr/pTyr-binding forkhead associated (FHA) protein
VTDPDDTLASQGSGGGGDAAQRVLLVLGGSQLTTHDLGPGKTVVIGRDAKCDVVLDHPKVSRRHALVHGDRPAMVEDAGGTNRVRLGDRTLVAGERAPLASGASFQVGPFTVVLLGLPSAIGESAEGRAALVLRDPVAASLSELIVRVAGSDVSVLIRGETGVGKDVLARLSTLGPGATARSSLSTAPR